MTRPDLTPIETPRLLLRGWRDSDLPSFAAMNADPAVMRHFPATLSRPESDALAQRIRADLDANGWGLWAVEVRGGAEFAGFVGLKRAGFPAPFPDWVEIGWRLAAAQWNRGYATEAARAALDQAFGPVGLQEVVSFTVPANAASRRVMEKLGLRHDPGEDFDHPRLPPGHPLRRHVLYRIRAGEWPCRPSG